MKSKRKDDSMPKVTVEPKTAKLSDEKKANLLKIIGGVDTKNEIDSFEMCNEIRGKK